jgi:regulator of RNase E activity RraB
MSEDAESRTEAGLRVVQLLREQGCDLDAERVVSHYFVGDPERLGDVARVLFLSGYRVLRASDDACLAEAMSIVSETWVGEITAEFMALADEHGVTYDGWEAATDAPSVH